MKTLTLWSLGLSFALAALAQSGAAQARTAPAPPRPKFLDRRYDIERPFTMLALPPDQWRYRILVSNSSDALTYDGGTVPSRVRFSIHPPASPGNLPEAVYDCETLMSAKGVLYMDHGVVTTPDGTGYALLEKIRSDAVEEPAPTYVLAVVKGPGSRPLKFLPSDLLGDVPRRLVGNPVFPAPVVARMSKAFGSLDVNEPKPDEETVEARLRKIELEYLNGCLTALATLHDQNGLDENLKFHLGDLVANDFLAHPEETYGEWGFGRIELSPAELAVRRRAQDLAARAPGSPEHVRAAQDYLRTLMVRRLGISRKVGESVKTRLIPLDGATSLAIAGVGTRVVLFESHPGPAPSASGSGATSGDLLGKLGQMTNKTGAELEEADDLARLGAGNPKAVMRSMRPRAVLTETGSEPVSQEVLDEIAKALKG